ncbi:MAG: acyl-CoA thioesterase [Hyphomonas oceanitis]|nr:acyl-CoA thioesterase [Hyphomonas oceanitis]
MMYSAYKGVAHPWLCDVMGHMTTRHYVAMFDDASYHFLNEVFGWMPGASDGPGWVDVKHTITYEDEVAAGDLLEVRAALAKIGGKSITVIYEMHNLTKGGIAANLESVSVYFDLTDRKAITIPDALRASAQSFLQPGDTG